MSERSFVMVKPDGVAAGLTGEVISRIERRRLRLIAIRKVTIVARWSRWVTTSTPGVAVSASASRAVSAAERR